MFTIVDAQLFCNPLINVQDTICCSLKKVDESTLVRILLGHLTFSKNITTIPTKFLAMWIGSLSRDLTSYAFWYMTVIYGIWHSKNNKTYARDVPLLAIWVPSISISARFEDDNARDMKRPYRKHIQRIEAYLLWMLCGYVASHFLWWLTSMSPMPSEFSFRNCLGDGKERRIFSGFQASN